MRSNWLYLTLRKSLVIKRCEITGSSKQIQNRIVELDAFVKSFSSGFISKHGKTTGEQFVPERFGPSR